MKDLGHASSACGGRRPDDGRAARPVIFGRRAAVPREVFEATSVPDIAAATGPAVRQLVYHFKTKQDILAAVMEEGLQRALERIEAISATQLSPRESLRALAARAHLDNDPGAGHGLHPGAAVRVARASRRSRGPRVVALQRSYESSGRSLRSCSASASGRSRRASTGCCVQVRPSLDGTGTAPDGRIDVGPAGR